jgi:phosphoribosyl-ATP pyrophosphohydrolase
LYIPLVNQSSNLYSQEKGLSLPKALSLEEGQDFWCSTECVRTNLDCNTGSLEFSIIKQGVEFCYLNRPSCFGKLNGLAGLEATLKSRFETAPEGSYIKGLFNGPNLLRSKIMEETLKVIMHFNRVARPSIASESSNIEHVTYSEHP